MRKGCIAACYPPLAIGIHPKNHTNTVGHTMQTKTNERHPPLLGYINQHAITEAKVKC
jgi:hypothetical protein